MSNLAVPPHQSGDLRRHLSIETPEHVVIDYELAGVGSRVLALIIDLALLSLAAAALLFVLFRIGGLNLWTQTLFAFVYLVANWGYFALFEGLNRGQTPGKRWIGLRVVRDSGHGIGMAEAILRNLLRVADYFPPPGLLGLAFIAFHPKGKRLGDLVAGTVVVRDRPVVKSVVTAASSDDQALGPPLLSDAAFNMLGRFLERRADLTAEARRDLTARILSRLREHLDSSTLDENSLDDLYRLELARRQSKSTTRSSGGLAERFVHLKKPSWDEFQLLATKASAGIDRLPPDELIEFATRYREVAADLARARTYRVSEGIQFELERAVAAGHNALYRARGKSWRRWWDFLGSECPAAIVRSSRQVALAFAVFIAPAIVGYLMLRDQPSLASDVLPAVIIDRAAEGADRRARGLGYFEAEPGSRPVVAANIIANNVQVAFMCFVGGIFLGVGSLIILAFNGLSIGAASGHFANAGLLGYLWTFVAGHGLLELFAIWVAGAAGLKLGLAAIAPGRYRRRDALAVAGQEAIRMITAVVLLLLIAGLIEGLLSASGSPTQLKLAVSGASALFLIGYLVKGAIILRMR